LFLGVHAAFVLITAKFMTPLKLSPKGVNIFIATVALLTRDEVRNLWPPVQYTSTKQMERFGHVSFTC
jgi:hypothetical protein